MLLNILIIFQMIFGFDEANPIAFISAIFLISFTLFLIVYSFFAEKIETGQIHINGGKFILDAPFGGWKNSGRGHELGLHGMQEYMSYRTLLG